MTFVTVVLNLVDGMWPLVGCRVVCYPDGNERGNCNVFLSLTMSVAREGDKS